MAFRLHPVDPGPAIPPPPGEPGGAALLTGLHTLARLTPEEGLIRLWKLPFPPGKGSSSGQESFPAEARIRMEIVDRTGSTESTRPMEAPSLRTGPGRWERRIPLEGGGEVVERGLLCDDVPGTLLEWTVRGHSPPGEPCEAAVVHLALEGPNRQAEPAPATTAPSPERTLPLSPGSPPVRVAILPVPTWDTPAGTVGIQGDPLKLLAQTLDRARVRQERSELLAGEQMELTLGEDDQARSSLLSLPLQILDQAPLGSYDGASGPLRPHGGRHILAGLEEGRPRFLSGAGVAEFGLAALLAGRRATALGILRAPGSIPTTAPLPWLLLCSRWCLWTGIPDPFLQEGEALRGLKAALEAAAAEKGDAGRKGGPALDVAAPSAGAPASGGAAFPSLPRVLEELSAGLGNAPGHGTSPGIEAVTRARLALESRSPGSRPLDGPDTGPFRVPLPVLGSPATPPPEVAPDHPSLPPPEAFAPLDAPAVAPHRTLHAARLVRSWIEGRFGAEADAGVGRLTLSPQIRPAQSGFALRRLAVGDARVSLSCSGDYRGGRAILTFRLHQESGRVPVNLVFQPLLPLVEVEQVRMGEEEVEAEVEARREGGLLLRCQFPLDSERRLVIEGQV